MMQPTHTLLGIVTEVRFNESKWIGILIKKINHNSLIWISGQQDINIVDPNGTVTKFPDINVGDKVELTYSGSIYESSPARIYGSVGIRILP
jgi:hypothetical protein